MREEKVKIISIQAGRGIAAAMVVFYHAYLILKQPEYSGVGIFGNVAELGILGVNFFFVLSGFIILMAHQKDIGLPSSAPKYVFRRILRVYPIYWIFLVAYIGASAIGLGYPDFSWDLGSMANAFTLLPLFPQVGALPLKVAWTLFFEIQFYLLFTVLLINRSIGIAVFAAWIVVMLLEQFSVVNLGQLSSVWNIHFILGMAAYVAYRKLPDWFGAPAIIVGVLCIATFMVARFQGEQYIKDIREQFLLVIAIGFSCVVYGIAALERKIDFVIPVTLKFLGDASYSTYLVHSAFISVFLIILKKLGFLSTLSPYLIFFVLIVAATIVGCVAYVALEKPLLWIARKLMRSKQ